MIFHIFVFLISLFALSKGADLFVEYSAKIAKRLGVSDLVIGLTITSIGTSIPELASSISASMNNAPELIVGNIVGSNIANIGLILGLSAFIRSIRTDAKMHDRDGFIMIASTALFFLFSLNNILSQTEAWSLLALYILYLFFVVLSSVQQRAYQFRDFMKFVFDFEYLEPVRQGIKKRLPYLKNTNSVSREGLSLFSLDLMLVKEIFVIILSAVLIVFGAKYLIEEALWTAKQLNIPENILGLTMIAIGTSLPELMVSVAAARQDKGGIVVGNIIGSNIANLLFIGGVSGSIAPLTVAEQSITYSIPIMLFFSLLLLYFVKTDWIVTRAQGFVLLGSYVGFIISNF